MLLREGKIERRTGQNLDMGVKGLIEIILLIKNEFEEDAKRWFRFILNLWGMKSSSMVFDEVFEIFYTPYTKLVKKNIFGVTLGTNQKNSKTVDNF